MKLSTKFTFKEGVNPEDLMHISPNLLLVFGHFVQYCHTRNLPIVITSGIRPEIPGVSVSTTHSTGRAFDISVMGWTFPEIEAAVHYFNNSPLFLDIAAISRDTLKPTLIVYHEVDNRGKHFHIQTRS